MAYSFDQKYQDTWFSKNGFIVNRKASQLLRRTRNSEKQMIRTAESIPMSDVIYFMQQNRGE